MQAFSVHARHAHRMPRMNGLDAVRTPHEAFCKAARGIMSTSSGLARRPQGRPALDKRIA
jgi:hypothetical protein